VETLTAAEGKTLRAAVLFAIAGEGVLTLMDTLIKDQTSRYALFQVTFLRFAFGALVATALVAVLRPRFPGPEALRFHGLRAFLSVFTASTFFYGLSKMPIAEAMALGFLSPLFMVVFGVLLLKERVDAKIAMALAAGIAGMIVIVSGQMSGAAYTVETLKGALAIVVSAVLYALVVIMLRARANVDPISVIVFLQSAIPAALLAIPAWFVWQPLTRADAGRFAIVGALAILGHTLIANAFKRAEAARLAPIHYTILLWGILYGYLFFGDVPALATVAGAALIAVATAIVQRR
jgi:drug/metabolite transporter (DMT)-like permease